MAVESCKGYQKVVQAHMPGDPPKRPPTLSQSEAITLMVVFHLKSYRNFKHFHTCRVSRHVGDDLPREVSYNRLVELMAPALMPMVLLRRRSPIETVNDALKNIRQVEHSRHRSFVNLIANLISGLAAYCSLPKKPSLRYETVKTDQLSLF